MFENITLEKIDENKAKIHLNDYSMYIIIDNGSETIDIDYDTDILTEEEAQNIAASFISEIVNNYNN
jgi:hypothetical protein